MAHSQDPTPFKFPASVLHNEIRHLETPARAELLRFLKALQQNPLSPDFIGEKENCGDKHACEFYYGYVIYWMLRMNGNHVTRIDILQIKTVRDLMHGH